MRHSPLEDTLTSSSANNMLAKPLNQLLQSQTDYYVIVTKDALMPFVQDQVKFFGTCI